MLHSEPETEREIQPESQREPQSHRDSLWLSLRISLQSICLAHKALARLIAALLCYSTLSWYDHNNIIEYKLVRLSSKLPLATSTMLSITICVNISCWKF